MPIPYPTTLRASVRRLFHVAKYATAALFCSLLPTVCQAQDAVLADSAIAPRKIITNSRLVGIGGVSLLDTYITPEEYSGTELRYISRTIREREGRHWVRLIRHEGRAALARNRADNANDIAADYTFTYGLLHRWTMLDGRLDVSAGASADLNAGFLYNTRGGNNPAQARLSLNAGPVAAAEYRFSVGKQRMAVCYEAQMPLCGLMFSPNYGQSYYEIFSRGDYDHNVVPTTVIATPSLRQTVTLDIRIKHATLSLGYLCDLRQAKVNNLKYHSYSHMFVFGLKRRFSIVKI